MAKSRFSIFKYVKVGGAGWRYCRAAFHDNGKIKSNVVMVGKDKHEEKHPEGAYYLANAGQWIRVNGDALEAQRKRKEHLTLEGIAQHYSLLRIVIADVVLDPNMPLAAWPVRRIGAEPL
jgi:hypothetical protein